MDEITPQASTSKADAEVDLGGRVVALEGRADCVDMDLGRIVRALEEAQTGEPSEAQATIADGMAALLERVGRLEAAESQAEAKARGAFAKALDVHRERLSKLEEEMPKILVRLGHLEATTAEHGAKIQAHIRRICSLTYAVEALEDEADEKPISLDHGRITIEEANRPEDERSADAWKGLCGQLRDALAEIADIIGMPGSPDLCSVPAALVEYLKEENEKVEREVKRAMGILELVNLSREIASEAHASVSPYDLSRWRRSPLRNER